MDVSLTADAGKLADIPPNLTEDAPVKYMPETEVAFTPVTMGSGYSWMRWAPPWTRFTAIDSNIFASSDPAGDMK